LQLEYNIPLNSSYFSILVLNGVGIKLQVLVMTPQILVDGLDNNSITLDKVNLMVLDECHHASKNHPYAKIMRVSDCICF
jgi:superfamily II DNA or RNA helicase